MHAPFDHMEGKSNKVNEVIEIEENREVDPIGKIVRNI